MAEKQKRGTFIHGIAASEHLDSSGERIKIEGVDISSLTKDGTFNYEHDSKSPASIVGKILEAKKILKREDCENDHHRYFWDKIRMPFIYVAGELFDSVGHKQAGEVAAMVRYDQLDAMNKDAKRLINFSIEGSRVEKSGQIITKCIARKVSVTLTPCNKVCEAEELKIDQNAKTEADSGKFSFIQDIMSKSDEPSCQIMKGEIPFLYKNEEVAKAERKPLGMFSVYRNPYLRQQDFKQQQEKQDAAKKPKEPKKKLGKYDSNVRKALTASCGMGSPSTRTQGDALQKEQFLYKNEDAPAQNPNGFRIGKTQTGKDVFSHAKIHEYKDFSPEDHVDAAEFHRQMVLKSPSFKDKEMHLDKMRLHNAAFSTAQDRKVRQQDLMAKPAPKPMPMQKPAQAGPGIPPQGTPSSPQGSAGYSQFASQYGKAPVAAAPAATPPSSPAIPNQMTNPNLKIAKSEDGFYLLAKSSYNVKEQRKKVFGTSAAPKLGSAMRDKHMDHIKNFVSKFLNLDLRPSGGKVDDKTGQRRNEVNEEGVDKPDWRSGSFESQWNPEAAIHEIAHLMLLPQGVGLEEGQRLMDKQYSDVQKQYGYLQQKRSKHEVQPMAAEQLIRRFLGLPPSQVSIPVKSKDDPHRVSVEDGTPIATRVKQGKTKTGEDRYVDLIRQSRNLHPEHRQRLQEIFSGNLKFHPDKGWVKSGRSLDAAITNRPAGAVMARQAKKNVAAPQELPPNVVRMKQPAAPQPTIDAPAVDPETTQQPMKIAKSEQREIMRMLGEKAFESFEKKEELLSFLKEKLPNLSDKERIAVAKAVAYTSQKKKELALRQLMDNDDE